MFKCYASSGYVSFGNNYIKPCCMSATKIPLDFNSFDDALTVLKDELNQTSWPKNCSWCKNLEDNNKKSLRNKIENLFPALYKYDLSCGKLQYLELMIDNTCNMNCIMCNENFSSKWNSIYQKTSNVDNFDKIIQMLKRTDTTHLRVLRILGGEPFYSKNVLTFLENIETYVNTDIGKVTLLFNTNCSNFPNKLLDVLKKFKNVHITVSIDGIEEVAEYFRPGVSWKQIEDVYKQWVSFSISNKHLMTIQSCLHIGNIEHTDKLYSWYNSNKCNGISLNYVQDDHLSIDNLDQNFLKKFHINYNSKPIIDYKKIFNYIEFFDSINKNKFAQVSPLVYAQLQHQRMTDVQV